MFSLVRRLFSRRDRRRLFGWKDAAIVLLGGLLAGFVILGYFAYTLPLPDGFTAELDRPSMLIKAERGEVFASRGIYRGDRLTVDDVPAHLLQAVVAIEDKRFYEHPGIDLRGIGRALMANLKAGGVRQGGSTITQQLAKTYFLEQDRTIKRKIQDMMLALWLENRLEKDEILARYLNQIYFGAGAYGVDAASWRYFRKSARALTLQESAMLAGLIQAPSWYSPARNLEAAQSQADLVLMLMHEQGYIDGDQVLAAQEKPATLAVSPDAHPGWNYFADWTEEETRRLLGPMTADLQVETTLVPEIQALAESTVARWSGILGSGEDSVQTALVAMTLDGGIVAMFGGKDYGESQFNRATKAKRQPGSAFKLFVYLAALDAGFTPDSLAMDEPIEIEGWSPRNHNGRFEGQVTLRTAFAQSINTVAVKLTEHVGREKVIGVARLLGVNSEIRPSPSMPLGSFETTLLELTGAYAAIAADVKRVEPYAIREIRGRGRTLYRYSPPPGARRGILPWKREEMLDMLVAAVKQGTGRAADIGRPVAGKTGTSEGNRDGWFIGFTGDLVVGVWVGRDDNKPVEGLSGGGLPARIWHDFMTEVYRSPSASAKTATVATTGNGGSFGNLPANGKKPLSFEDIGDVIKQLFNPE
jgi:1A family penicillin-binding protein